MDATQLTVVIITALLALGLGLLIGHLRAQREVTTLREAKIKLSSELAHEQRSAADKIAALEKAQAEARGQLSDTFGAMASEALKHNSSEFLKLAQENLKQFQTQAQGELSQREKAVENLVKPIREALQKTESQIQKMESERQSAYGSLSKHLETMAEAQRLLQGETRNLVQALRRPEVRGQWGEMTLKRLAELAGMVEHCDFYEQEQVQTEEGALRPDMIVRMPDGREIIVDAKTPLDAYLSAVEATDDESRQRELARHTRKVRERVKELASKSYWQQFKNSPDFVVLFIPGDQFLTAALDNDRKLLEDALADKVILATPTSFVALLRAVAYGWRQEALADNAENIRKLGEEMYDRLATFADHLSKVGKSLDSSVNHYNKAVGSFDTRILPSARKFTEMGISAKKEVGDSQQIERAPRRVESAETSSSDSE
ncbi:recombinase RmuC [Solemya pervernicosa gill symbiont]|uniref:Recombinase RmuC n=2 Tax=Gammaproteobacteria incertae sedis TaxID=118884 RepID=A0A1T2L6A3_9GAMM|nr:DNA recombination protein RmuC [Candidatus Reidiella endopervernicosa]OOZ40613.1 recombinase RmuC [Solemya pervernicosa gill symbiont]QKQ26634.1 DNA recombination protein RmuC [Candidatus Reidiella endopervernicosa]